METLYPFNKEIETHQLLVETYNVAALSEKICREWFQKFKNDDFDVEDKDRSGWPKIYEDAELDEHSSRTQKELELTLEVIQQAVLAFKTVIRTLRRPTIIRSGQWHMLCQGSGLHHIKIPKNWVDSWIALKDKEFFRLGIRRLPER
ncbi:Mariner Mos1 transposase [Eumeta japonica]|uniref:Mariner Mos1 transposase n=1 Tax=Eumeta variegata TaxID=151549 RepID=A0A4C1YMP3_EUMVA|nr:Mariner Mos1 transposase [Eumeta japonica]